MKKTKITLLLFIALIIGVSAKNAEKKNEIVKKEVEIYSAIIYYIKSHEGLRLNNYNCTAGVNTIGWGHVILRNEKYKKISLKQANDLFLRDFNKRFDVVSMKFPKLERRQKLILTASTFNLGIGIVYGNNSITRAIKSGKSIKWALLKYSLVNGKWDSVISKRRNIEARIYDMTDDEVKSLERKYKKEVINQINKQLKK